MTEAPKKIWLRWGRKVSLLPGQISIKADGDIPYIRADIVDELVEALNEETIRWEYEKTEQNLRTVTLTKYGWFDAGVRFAEKHHGIGGGDE